MVRRHHDLTNRERAIVRRLARGDSDRELTARTSSTDEAVRSAIRWLRDRTGLAGLLSRLLDETAIYGDLETVAAGVDERRALGVDLPIVLLTMGTLWATNDRSFGPVVLTPVLSAVSAAVVLLVRSWVEGSSPRQRERSSLT